jgi:hypothetical protein
MFGNMNINIKLNLLTYISWLQIVLDILNSNILFHIKRTCLDQELKNKNKKCNQWTSQ